MKRPSTVQGYTRLVEEALGEMEDVQEAIELDGEEMGPATAFVSVLASRVRELSQRMEDETYSFEDRDLPFMELVAHQSAHFLPFKGLLELINETHRQGLESSS